MVRLSGRHNMTIDVNRGQHTYTSSNRDTKVEALYLRRQMENEISVKKTYITLSAINICTVAAYKWIEVILQSKNCTLRCLLFLSTCRSFAVIQLPAYLRMNFSEILWSDYGSNLESLDGLGPGRL